MGEEMMKDFDGTQYEYTDYCIAAHVPIDVKTLNVLGENGFRLVCSVPYVIPSALKGAEMGKQIIFVREKVYELTPEEAKELMEAYGQETKSKEVGDGYTGI